MWLAAFCIISVADASAADVDLKTLQALGVEPTAKGIGSFLREPDSLTPNREAYGKLISQLGDDRFAVRERATAALEKAPLVYRDMLEKAVASRDLEVSMRATVIMESVQTRAVPDEGDVMAAALRVSTGRKIKGLTESVLAAAARLEDERVDHLAKQMVLTLQVTMTSDDLAALTRSLKHGAFGTRLVAVRALATIPGAKAKDFAVLLKDEDERVRLSAACAILNREDRRGLEALADLVGCSDKAVRLRSARALAQALGYDVGDLALVADAKRAAGVAKQWQERVRKLGDEAKLRLPVAEFTLDTRGLVLHYSFESL